MNGITFVPQSEADECGLACLAMIAGYHGLAADLPTLRRRLGPRTGGMTLRDLERVSSSIGLSMRATYAEFEDLETLRLPGILHYKNGHFVVIASQAREGGLTKILDPFRGVRRLDARSLIARFTGVAVEFRPRSAVTCDGQEQDDRAGGGSRVASARSRKG